MSDFDFAIKLNGENELDLEEGAIPCGQKIRTEDEIASDGIKDFENISQIRYPLLTMAEVLKYHLDMGKIPPFVHLNFSGNLGSKDNKDALKPKIDSMLKNNGLELSRAMLKTINERIEELNEQLKNSVSDHMSMINIETALGGSSRTKLANETRVINDNYTRKLKSFAQSLKPDHKPSHKPYKKTETKQRNDVNVNKELSKLIKKFAAKK